MRILEEWVLWIDSNVNNVKNVHYSRLKCAQKEFKSVAVLQILWPYMQEINLTEGSADGQYV